MLSFFNKKIKLFGPALVAAAFILLPLVTLAATNTAGQYDNSFGSNPDNNFGSNSYDNTFGGGNTLQNPLGVNSICDLIGLLLKAAIAIGIPIAVLFIVYAGFKFVVARGSPGELSEARSNLVATLIGIAIFVGASLIANVLISTLHELGANNVTSCSL